MAGFKEPDLNQRLAAARAAKQSALEKLRSKPAPDPELLARRQAARAARDAAAADKRATRQRAAEEAAAAKAAKRAQAAERAAAEKEKAERDRPTEAELKAARDARYAARKARKR